MNKLLNIFIVLGLIGCASQQKSTIHIGLVEKDLIFEEFGSSNQNLEGNFTNIGIDSTVPVSGAPVPVEINVEGTGMFSRLRVRIDRVGGDIKIKRDFTGNIGVDIPEMIKSMER